MTHALKFVLPLLLVASPAAAQPTADTAESGPVTRQTATRETPLLDFEYSWPEAISSEPQLVARLREDLSKSYDEALNYARKNKQDMAKVGGSFRQNQFTRMWTLAGQTPRLTSLVANTDTYAGGAHPNHMSSALLWDRSAKREINFAELFDSPTGLKSAVRARYCKLLDAERLKRRQRETLGGGFSQCPAFSDLSIVPADENGTGRFDSVHLIADPYVARPYAEGDYGIVVAVSAELIAALDPEHRSDFEAQPPQ